MSTELLARLQASHAFDPVPKRVDLGAYYVPFAELVEGVTEPKDTLLAACRRCERVALVGDSGGGKSSVIASGLGPTCSGSLPSRFRSPPNRSPWRVSRDCCSSTSSG